ncbi:unnamed protein product [Heligmosomoides polygyrus]|uniref:7TM_GPCR_Srx domain-containing protein n=1 Tax=Heligmosomoides polygyrus TaxID=6339 RepID=A0A3P7X1F5_HELPZ|nr:unnamed protein product [Heligmosomoides polygyrus]
MVEVTRILVGLFLFSESCIILLLNLFVMACIIKSRLYAKKDNSVYFLAGFNIAVDIGMLLLHVLYIGPSVMAGSWFFDGQDSLGVEVTAVIFMGLWYLGSVLQILFAVNRITPDPRFFGYSYLKVPGEIFNLSMYYVDLPLDLGTSIICGISYMVLFTYIIKAGSSNDKVGRRELRNCIQFLLMFLTYTVAWVTFFAYPAIGIKEAEAYVVTPAIVVLNSGTNSIIYLILNMEVLTKRRDADHFICTAKNDSGRLRLLQCRIRRQGPFEEEIKLAGRMASILKDIEARQLELSKTNRWKWWKNKKKIGVRKMN